MTFSKSLITLILVSVILFTFFSASIEQQEDAATAAHLEALLKDTLEAQGEKHQFQAEINQLLSIIINSLYSNKDIFLRELISNASDALNKLRFLALTNMDVLKTGEKFEIRVRADKAQNVLIIRDTGIGMTKEDLVNNLGTIAKSGTKAFLEKMKKEANSNLIGQFGVGFYSSFLVADKVVVRTKSNDDDKQWIWTSKADNSFVITEDPAGNTLGRGTEIILHLKEEAKEYLDSTELRLLIQKYSEFTHFPIYLYETRTVTEEVPVEEVKEETATEQNKEEKVDVESDSEDKETEKPKTKKIQKEVGDWSQVNQNKPIWTKPISEVTKEEYNGLFRSLSIHLLDLDDPLTYTHFNAEGNVAFTSILYVPSKTPQNTFDLKEKKNLLKLYVKRVFIMDAIEHLLPRYLSFMRGIVDSDDLPLNVSREQLQHSKLLTMIKNKLTVKAIQMLSDLADQSKITWKEYKKKKAQKDAENAGKQFTEEEKKEMERKEKEEAKEADKYKTFWTEFGKNVRLGVIDDQKNRKRLLPLLRYYSTKSEDELTSLDDYISRMPEKQKYIYYIAGESVEECRNSPFLEALNKRGYEVLYLTDAIDEYMMQQVRDYKGKPLESITREDLRFGDEDEEDEKRKREQLEKEFEPLTSFLATTLGPKKIQKATIGKRISDSPCVLVTPSYGISANMARIMKAQTLGSGSKNEAYKIMAQIKMMEINPNHPVIIELNKKVKTNPSDPVLHNMTQLLYETALLRSGFEIENKNEFANRVFGMMSTGLHLDEKTSSTKAQNEKPSASSEKAKDEL
jgi:heat shock protein beta